jgi:transposase
MKLEGAFPTKGECLRTAQEKIMEEIRCEMKPYSQDLRERVVKAVDEGLSRSESAHLFGVSEATIKRYLKLRCETGNLAPKPIPGYPPRKIGALQKGLKPQLEAHPDATLEEHCRLWEAQTGVKVSISTMSDAIKRLKWTWKKKTVEASERKEEERQAFREKVKELDGNTCRIIDETGSNLALTRRYARAPKGKRARGTTPRKRGKNVTMITDLSLRGLGEVFLTDGAANGDLFEAYIGQIFAPTLSSGEIVIMDNSSIHKGKKVRELIEARGCQLLFLPAYSPDLSPIEEAFSKVKTVLRSIGARTREALYEALETATATVTVDDASGWFRHCGYHVPDPPEQEAA